MSRRQLNNRQRWSLRTGGGCRDRSGGRTVYSAREARRAGIATVWVIASVPALAVLLCVVIEVGNLWMARVELRNALDAAALSAVKTWGEGGSTSEARQEAQQTAELNTVTGDPVMLDSNAGAGPNGNDSNDGDILLGAITGSPGSFTFDCNQMPSCSPPNGDFGVRTKSTTEVNSVCDTVFGTSIGPFDVTSASFARFPCPNGPPELVRIQTFTCP